MVAPGHGWWRWNSGGADETTTAGNEPNEPVPAVDELIADLQPSLHIEKELGNGSECVYLYFNPNDRRLAELEDRRFLGMQDRANQQLRRNWSGSSGKVSGLPCRVLPTAKLVLLDGRFGSPRESPTCVA